jgi:hypothetical protein
MTLRQRAAAVAVGSSSASDVPDAADIVLDSRKQQIKITAKLDQHCRAAHLVLPETA